MARKSLKGMLANMLLASLTSVPYATPSTPMIRNEPRKVRGAGSGDNQKVEPWRAQVRGQPRYPRPRFQ